MVPDPVSTLAVEWIEMYNDSSIVSYMESPPSRWSGLKSEATAESIMQSYVSTLAVEWIEIDATGQEAGAVPVSTLAVEWIEILLNVLSASAGLGLHPRGGVD